MVKQPRFPGTTFHLRTRLYPITEELQSNLSGLSADFDLAPEPYRVNNLMHLTAGGMGRGPNNLSINLYFKDPANKGLRVKFSVQRRHGPKLGLPNRTIQFFLPDLSDMATEKVLMTLQNEILSQSENLQTAYSNIKNLLYNKGIMSERPKAGWRLVELYKDKHRLKMFLDPGTVRDLPIEQRTIDLLYHAIAGTTSNEAITQALRTHDPNAMLLRYCQP